MSEGAPSGQAVGGIALGPIGRRTASAPEWVELLNEAAQSASGTPTAILLPEIQFVGETTAILCAREKARCATQPATTALKALEVGHRVRVLPDEGVYEYVGASDGGIWLHPLDKLNRQHAGRFRIPEKEAGRLEPTSRKRPLGKANRHEWAPLTPTAWDQFTGSPIWGNASLARLAVVLVGLRTDFTAALSSLGFAALPGERGVAIADGLPWGRVEEEGDLELLHSSAASGHPVIAIARDHVSARRLAERSDPGSLLFISARADDALQDRTSVEILAERHACLVLAPARLREAFLERRANGWLVTDLSGSPALEAEATGIPALDKLSASSQWMTQKPSTLAQSSPELEEAFRLLNIFTRGAGPHLGEDEDVTEAARLLRQAFYEASDWLAPPDVDALEELNAANNALLDLALWLRSVVGEETAGAAKGVFAALKIFAETAASKAMTPKGECLIRLAESAFGRPSYRQVIVAGHRSTASAATAFLEALNVPMTCVTPTELAALEGVRRVNVLSVMKRETFMRLVDPWAAPDMMFLGYQHEVDIYRSRLAGRQRMIDRLRPDERLLAKVPRLRAVAFAKLDEQPVDEPVAADPLAIIPRPQRRPPPTSPGEQSRPARFCRFSGRSWMAMTDDHAVARLQTNSGQKTQVTTITCKDLQVGDLILVREGGEKDIVREMAEQLAGRDNYYALRGQAAYWRKALRTSGHPPERLKRLLAGEGLERGLFTIRNWMAEDGPIGPSDPDNALPLIAAALGEGPTTKQWKACLDAIHDVRRYHVMAGFHLTKALMNECGDAILEHSEHETAFELSLGTVWLLEIEQLEDERRPWPYAQANKIQWESEAWHRRLLRKSAPTTTLDLNTLFSDIPSDYAVEEA